MTLKWGDPNITDCSTTHQDRPISDVDPLIHFYQYLAGMADGKTARIAFRIEGKVIGFTVERHNEMGEAPT